VYRRSSRVVATLVRRSVLAWPGACLVCRPSALGASTSHNCCPSDDSRMPCGTGSQRQHGEDTGGYADRAEAHTHDTHVRCFSHRNLGRRESRDWILKTCFIIGEWETSCCLANACKARVASASACRKFLRMRITWTWTLDEKTQKSCTEKRRLPWLDA
jgi:hypothetical protein